jgi:hypothetical protein
MGSRIENTVYGRLRDTEAAEMAGSRIIYQTTHLTGTNSKRYTHTHLSQEHEEATVEKRNLDYY